MDEAKVWQVKIENSDWWNLETRPLRGSLQTANFLVSGPFHTDNFLTLTNRVAYMSRDTGCNVHMRMEVATRSTRSAYYLSVVQQQRQKNGIASEEYIQ
jgi:hypothetical protein